MDHMENRHRHRLDDALKSSEELLADLVWIGVAEVHLLRDIRERLGNMATQEQVAALTSAIDELEAATTTEIGQINDKIDELIAQAGDQPDPALDAQIVRLQAQRDRIAAIIPDAPPAEPAP